MYDIAAYKDEILKGDIDKLSIKDIKMEEAEETEPQKQSYDFKVIFNVVVVITAVLLGFIILLNIRKKS